MASLTTWLWGTSQLDDAIDKATSELLPTDAEDIALNLEICDQIRSKSVSSKDAMRALKRRLNHKNPNVQLLALGLTDICIKNGGDQFLVEVASREFMDNLVSILKVPYLNMDVKNKILRLVQNWAVAFEGKTTLGYVGQVYRTLKSEGFNFPPQDLVVANSAMVDTQTAPEWIDSDVCLRCRTAFSFTNRKHHCRNCGQVFDQQCSSKTMTLPHFGINQEVRVCDGCYSKLSKKAERSTHRHSASVHSSRHRGARELADAELQRAIQLSLEEAGLASSQSRGPGYVPYQPSGWQVSEPPLVDRNTHPSMAPGNKSRIEDEENDPDLKAAIEASLREANAPKPSAPVVLETPRLEEAQFAYGGPGHSQSYPPATIPSPSVSKIPSYDLEPLESDAILTFNQTVEQLQSQGSRELSRYPAVNELYDKANALRPKLALGLDESGRKEQLLSEMHDKLSHAVKLYDQLLTEQLAHPTWRSQPSSSQSPYSQPYDATNGNYTQWAPQQPPSVSSPGFQRPTESAGLNNYSPRSAVPVSHPSPSTPFIQEQANQPVMASRPETYQPQHYTNAVEAPQQTWYQQQNTSHYHPSYSQPPPQQVIPPPTQPLTAGPSSVSHLQQDLASLSLTASAASSPAGIALPSQPLPKTTTPSLSRHNTYISSPPSVHGNHHIRSNTIAYTHAPASSSPQQQHQFYQPSPLPDFPVAPTSAPQAFPMYGPSIPTSPPPERKEALLIDL